MARINAFAYTEDRDGRSFEILANGGTFSNGQTTIWDSYAPSAPSRNDAEFLGYMPQMILSQDEPDLWDALYNWRHGGPQKIVEWYAYYEASSSGYYSTWPYTGGIWLRTKWQFDSSTGLLTHMGVEKLGPNGYWPYRSYDEMKGKKYALRERIPILVYPGERLHTSDCSNYHYTTRGDYFAVWAKRKGFSIKFDVNGGSVTISNQVANDITLPNPGTRPGYTFDGWYNGNTKIGGIGDKWKPTADATITAHWTPITYRIQYLTYGGYVTGNPVTYNVETPTFTLKNPTQMNMSFVGWSDRNNNSPKEEYTITKGTIGDITISANWKSTDTERGRGNSNNTTNNKFTIK